MWLKNWKIHTGLPSAFCGSYFGASRCAKYSNECVCLSVCLSVYVVAAAAAVVVFMSLYARISQKSHVQTVEFSVHITCGCASVLIWGQYHMLCTSSSVAQFLGHRQAMT